MSTVFAIDDDPSICRAIKNLLESVALHVEVFGSPLEFLKREIPEAPCCLLLDIRLPGVSGLEFQADLTKAGVHIPIIFMTGHGDIPMSVRAMKAGAIEFLTKPFREQEMLDAVYRGLVCDRERRDAQNGISDLRARFNTLTPREREVLAWVAPGLMNKQIAARMGIAQITVKLHRMQIRRKLGAKSPADLVRMADRLGCTV
jgi:FixJ family two-component response regulator